MYGLATDFGTVEAMRASSTPRRRRAKRDSEEELCRNLGDGADQAAWLSVGVTISMPLENLTPAITFGK